MTLDPPAVLVAPDLAALDLRDHDTALERDGDVDLVVLPAVGDPLAGDEHVAVAGWSRGASQPCARWW